MTIEDTLRLWKRTHRGRDSLVRRAHAAGLDEERIADLMGIGRSTVSAVLLGGAPAPFDLEAFEAQRAGIESARKRFWEEEAAGLPPGSLALSWHATMVAACWDVPGQTYGRGTGAVASAALRTMAELLPGPLLLRAVSAGRALELGFPLDGGGEAVVGVRYELPVLKGYRRFPARTVADAAPAVPAQQAGPPPWVPVGPEEDAMRAVLEGLVGHWVTVTCLRPRRGPRASAPRTEAPETATGRLSPHPGGRRFEVAADAGGGAAVWPREVVEVVDHGRP
ncbi:hypothetical protein [Nocardiopsis potens]|uniref:hypothetical protein n=1 Tax=Nocardiopsis potens TaxID=1246458 RepID=UPI0003458B59|nr:hypothetical protein [Nocardiopsis potens]